MSSSFLVSLSSYVRKEKCAERVKDSVTFLLSGGKQKSYIKRVVDNDVVDEQEEEAI